MKMKGKENGKGRGKASSLMPDYQDNCRRGRVIEGSRIEENENN